MRQKPSTQVLTAARQLLTHQWWNDERQNYELVVSQNVIDEASGGDPTLAAERLGTLDGIPLLPDAPEIPQIADEIMALGVLSAKAQVDALHIGAVAVEFTRRWSLHVLPKGYTKTRRYGGWSNPRREVYLEQCGKQLDAIEAQLSSAASDFGPLDEPLDPSERDCPSCPRCGGPMIPPGARDKRPWSEIMNSTACPPWYATSGSG